MVNSTKTCRPSYDQLSAGDEGGSGGLDDDRYLRSISDVLPPLEYLGETQLRDSLNQIISIRLINGMHCSLPRIASIQISSPYLASGGISD